MATFTRYSVHVRKKGNKASTPGLRFKIFEYDAEDRRREFTGWGSMTRFFRVSEDRGGRRYFTKEGNGHKHLFTLIKAHRLKRYYQKRGFEVRIEKHVLGKDWRSRIVQIARSQVGISESPAGSNRVKYSVWYGMIGPWCAMFTSWVYEQAGRSLRYAYVPYVVADARARRNGLRVVSKPQPGDLVCYQFGSEPDHIGIFVRWLDAGSFEAIEGNTSVTSNDNGGKVMVRHRGRQQVVAFVRVS